MASLAYLAFGWSKGMVCGPYVFIIHKVALAHSSHGIAQSQGTQVSIGIVFAIAIIPLAQANWMVKPGTSPRETK